MKKVSLISVTARGKETAEKIEKAFSTNSKFSFVYFDKEKESMKDFVKSAFFDADIIIFVCATGIAVRHIAPYIVSKDRDPAVICLDDRGNFAIPLLSGHLGGANEFALELSELIGATPVITTATDVNGKFAVDMWTKKNGCIIGDISKIKEISSRILDEKSVGFVSDFPVKGDLPEGICFDVNCKAGICVSFDEEKKPFGETLNAEPKIVILGVGCRKNTDEAIFEEEILSRLAEEGISVKAVEKLASIDIKKDEKCIIAFSKKYNIPFVTFSAEELMRAEGEFESSEFVLKTTGADNVCERSAVCAGSSEIIMKKSGGRGVTSAAAVREWECRF